MATTKNGKPVVSASNVFSLATQRQANLKEHIASSVHSSYYVFNQANNLSDIKVLILNGTLKQDLSQSTTAFLIDRVVREFEQYNITDIQILHLAAMAITVGTEEKIVDLRVPEDQMSVIYDGIKRADVLIMATPIMWGGVSSLIQKVIERLDVFDEIFLTGDDSILLGKTFGCIIVGAEDGAQQLYGRLLSWASFLGFTIPPMAYVYWVGEVNVNKHVAIQNIANNSVTIGMVDLMVRHIVNTTYIVKQAVNKNSI